ncbi:MAG TPA: hypothetical protein VGC63_00945 [Solirubrobacterales bacterium]|jgi:DNA-directed RNA polymerase specialized sigma24 family protein
MPGRPSLYPFERAEQGERLQGHLAEVSGLPARQRAALLMRELAALNFKEIASAREIGPPRPLNSWSMKRA